jgi:hypothetical protein
MMPMIRSASLLAALLWALAGSPAFAEVITPEGRALAQALDSLGVEEKWIAGKHVDWQTGLPDGRPEKLPGKHTHCSAFVAAAAKTLGIYILRPPEHGQVLLANAQYEWLGSPEAAEKGWHRLRDAREAQAAANRGELVVASYQNHHDDKPGHIAIVRPSDKSEAQILAEGPQIIQAGGRNYASTSVKAGFAGHPSAFKHDEIIYYAHRVRSPLEHAERR